MKIPMKRTLPSQISASENTIGRHYVPTAGMMPGRAVHLIADLTLGLGKVVHDYLA
jgi:acetoacetate decarboxylase